MKKGYFVTFDRRRGGKSSGVDKKIDMQIRTFNNNGVECKEYELESKYSKINALLTRLPFVNVFPRFKYDEVFSDADFIYIRRPFCFKNTIINFFKTIKKFNSNIKIILEIPTYPYDEEIINTKLGFIAIMLDRYYRKKLYKYVDRIATLTEDDKIFGIKTIRIDNGIDFSEISLRTPSTNINNEIHLCAIAMFSPWHGYERVIKGLHNYYKNSGKRNIIIHMVGDGSELNVYKKLVNQFKLNNHFIFYGMVNKKEIDKIYNICSISLGTFAAYKMNINDICNLKSTESLAYGVPFVNGCRISRFTEKGYKYLLELINDDSDIDFNKIVDFYDNIYANEKPEIVSNNIRKFGEKYFSMEICMKEVFDYIRT